MTVLYLALQSVAKRWTRPIRDWKVALNQLVILFGERVPMCKRLHRYLDTPATGGWDPESQGARREVWQEQVFDR